MELRNKGGIAAVLNFSGKATEEKVKNKAKELRHYLKKDGLKSVNNNSCLLVRYNDSNHTWSFVMVYFLCTFFLLNPFPFLISRLICFCLFV